MWGGGQAQGLPVRGRGRDEGWGYEFLSGQFGGFFV